MTKIVKIEELKIHVFWETWWISLKKLTLDHIKSDWKQSFTLSSDSIFFEVIYRVKEWI